MEERPGNSVDAVKTGASRRTALKLGAGAGVGMVAWSGMSITSLGGTPVYAAGCTFVVDITLEGCRNTTQEGDPFSYQPLNLSGLPAGYSFDQNIPNNTNCVDLFKSTLTFPAGITCTVSILFNQPPNCKGNEVGALVYTSDTGSLEVVFACVGPPFPSNTQQTIILECNTTGASGDCFN